VYVDNSYTAWGEKYQQAALKAIGKRKILYGIDSPKGSPLKEAACAALSAGSQGDRCLLSMDLDVISHVFYRNASAS